MKKISKFFGNAAAAYHTYWERENRKLQEEAKQRAKAILAENMRPEYEYIAQLLGTAINNTIELTHLSPVKNPKFLYCKKWMGKNKFGFYSFQYRERYIPGYNVTADYIRRILSNELNELCDVAAYPPLTVRVRFDADHRVRIFIAATADVRAARRIEI